jgi:hypothetical protein
MLLLLAKGAIIAPAGSFPNHCFCAFLALCMMGNNIIRAEGKANFAMVAMIIPAFVIILDIIL